MQTAGLFVVTSLVEIGLDVVLVADLPAARRGVSGDQTIPIHGQDFLHTVFLVGQVGDPPRSFSCEEDGPDKHQARG